MAPNNLFSNLTSSQPTAPTPKLHFTSGTLPDHIPSNNQQPSTSRPPFRQIHANPFIASVTLLLPPSLAAAFIASDSSTATNNDNVTNGSSSTKAASAPTTAAPPAPATTSTSTPKPQTQSNVPSTPLTGHIPTLPLSTLLSATESPPSGLLPLIQTPGLNLTLLSHPQSLATTPPPTLSLHAGTLTLHLSRPLYVQLGIPHDIPIKSGARKHGPEGEVMRVSLDLRTIKSGGKILQRWRRAAREVLTEGIACSVLLEGTDQEALREAKRTLEGLGVQWLTADRDRGTRVERDVVVPRGLLLENRLSYDAGVQHHNSDDDEEMMHELVEWADLVALGSPRVRGGDRVDGFVARYDVPQKDGSETVTQDVVVCRWEGLLSSEFVVRVLLGVVRASRRTTVRNVGGDEEGGGKPWAVLSVKAHHTQAVGNVDGCVLFLQPVGAAVDQPVAEQASGVADGGLGERQGMTGARASDLRRQSGKESDVVMDVDPKEQGDKSTASVGERKESKKPGLQRFVCCQFVDSRVHG